MAITYHPNLIQGADEWYKARLGLLTASEMDLIMTPSTMKAADNDKSRAHVYELLSQRITQYVEPSYVGDAMMRGWEDEVYARQAYEKAYAPVKECGFVTNDKWGFTIGYSPDGLVGDDGLIEVKSRRQKFQVQTMIENATEGTIPPEFVLQCQTGLLVTEREWIDFISYSGGLPMVTIRVRPIEAVQAKIIECATKFEEQIAAKRARYDDVTANYARLIPTERRIQQEMYA